jgi:LmbE family N-acetylglucosaminyl deacetylase
MISRSTGKMWLRLAGLAILPVLLQAPGRAQRNIAGSVRTRLALERLNNLGSVLMIGAHPDDENTGLLAYLARGRKVRAAYLSATRGEGGQNLIGSEQAEMLGLIRTQELLAARRIDGAEQFFTRAIDFGYSKTAEETLAKWDKERVLADIVWNIRRFRPDVIVIQHLGTPGDGHGHHQAVGILGREAFSAAASKSAFPEQLRWTTPWQARRMLGRGGGAGIPIDTGEFDPVLGYSYGEIAGMSRSMHKSQGMGAPEQRGASRGNLSQVAGDAASGDIFDGIDTTWNRLPGGDAAGKVLEEALRVFDPEQPDKTVMLLVKARPLIAAMKNPLASKKLEELDEAIALCTGLWLDASADRHAVVPGESLQVNLEAINRSRVPLTLRSVKLEGMAGAPEADFGAVSLAYNAPQRRAIQVSVPADQPYSQPFWLLKPGRGSTYVIEDQEMIGLAEPPPILRARFVIRAGLEDVDLVRPVIRRYVDRVEGETSRPLVAVPPVAVRISEPILVFPDGKAKKVEVLVRSNIAGAAGDLKLAAPAEWGTQPASLPFHISEVDAETTLSFSVSAPEGTAVRELRAVAVINGREISSDMQVIAYAGMPTQTVFPPSNAKLVRADIRNLAVKIGYIMGAGDEVPAALRQLGCEVTLLGSEDLATADLAHFDAIVAGVRAYNVRADLRANQKRLLEYVQQGGALIVQYNVVDRRSPTMQAIGPFPLQIGSARVSVEEAPVAFLNPQHPLLAAPNRIGEEDFRGWIQERGLYFAAQWDGQYEALFATHDPNEDPLKGGTLYTRYGKGVYIFTAFSWFRQLPAGVPGAYRLFANLLSAAKSAR